MSADDDAICRAIHEAETERVHDEAHGYCVMMRESDWARILTALAERECAACAARDAEL